MQKSTRLQNTNENTHGAAIPTSLKNVCFQCHEKNEVLVRPCKCEALWDVECLRSQFHRLREQNKDSLGVYSSQYGRMYTTQCVKCFQTMKYIDEICIEVYGLPKNFCVFIGGWFGLVGWNILSIYFISYVWGMFVFQILLFLLFFMTILPTIYFISTLRTQIVLIKQINSVQQTNLQLYKGQKLCRVCFQSHGQFVQPCSCMLPTPHIHKYCLEKIIQQDYTRHQKSKRKNIYHCKCQRKIHFLPKHQCHPRTSNIQIWVGIILWLLSWIIPLICGLQFDNWDSIFQFYTVTAFVPTPIVFLVFKQEIWKTRIQVNMNQIDQRL